MRKWRQGVRKLLLLLYAAALLISLGCFLWNASAPVRVHSAPKCYPSKGDEFSLAPVPTLPADSILNTGDAAALDALPGIGTVLSERIVAYREEHGAFVYPEELRNVKGIGEKRLQAILDALAGEKCGGKRLTGTKTDHTNTKLHHQGDDSHVPHPISRRRRCLG